jgi:spore germination cell wall hydrolase CwlJ-like protein
MYVINWLSKLLFLVLISFPAHAFLDSPLREQQCLADNIYWEARNQTTDGMIAVGLVTRNRVKDDRFPDTYCEVVYQGPTRPSWVDPTVQIPVKHRCQFSWYCDGKSDDIPEYDEDVYSLIRTIALKIYWHAWEDFTQGATHYHAWYVQPEWADTKTITIGIGDHIFYRWE